MLYQNFKHMATSFIFQTNIFDPVTPSIFPRPDFTNKSLVEPGQSHSVREVLQMFQRGETVTASPSSKSPLRYSPLTDLDLIDSPDLQSMDTFERLDYIKSNLEDYKAAASQKVTPSVSDTATPADQSVSE